jgi:hypothetical protein
MRSWEWWREEFGPLRFVEILGKHNELVCPDTSGPSEDIHRTIPKTSISSAPTFLMGRSPMSFGLDEYRTRARLYNGPVSASSTHPPPILFRGIRPEHQVQPRVHQEKCVLKIAVFALYSRASPWTTLHPCAGSFLALVPRVGSRGSEVRMVVGEAGVEEVMEEGSAWRGNGVRGGCVVELHFAGSLKTFQLTGDVKALTVTLQKESRLFGYVW